MVWFATSVKGRDAIKSESVSGSSQALDGFSTRPDVKDDDGDGDADDADASTAAAADDDNWFEGCVGSAGGNSEESTEEEEAVD